ncbi:MAG: GtrA family protein [Lachnospiraceae bacterium]|nr:GtrA family protein [Lachnospiraceae bacterium]
MDKIKQLFIKYEEIIIYLIVGVLTTIVSWGAAWVAKFFLDDTVVWQNGVINTISWVAGVLFAYPLNRKWVFKSTNPKILSEFMGFAGSRVSTWIMDIVIMYVTVNVFHMNYWIAKICISAVVVTIANYIFSKLLVFKKKEK